MRKTQAVLISATLAFNSFVSTVISAESRVDALLEEVVVTARKREEGLQEAPISISALTVIHLNTVE